MTVKRTLLRATWIHAKLKEEQTSNLHCHQGGRAVNPVRKACGNNAPKKSAIYKWITHFKKGWDILKKENKIHSGISLASNLQEKSSLVHINQRLVINGRNSIWNHRHLNWYGLPNSDWKIKVKQTSVQWMLKLLIYVQVKFFRGYLNKWDQNLEISLCWIKIVDEKLFCQYNPDDKSQSM